MMKEIFIRKIKKEILETEVSNFENIALEVFRWQAKYVSTYKEYIEALNIKAESVKQIEDIPFLPIQFFKNKTITSRQKESPQYIFESSGTTGSATSKHFIYDGIFAHQLAKQIFEKEYGSLNEFQVFALLPSYLERNNSSLVFMVNYFIENAHRNSGFFLNNIDELIEKLERARVEKQKTLLIGVTFALLDLAERGIQLGENIVIMETGGMKGRRKELVRSDLHDYLISKFRVSKIHSEYGMTELTSQGYSKGDGIFTMPRCMKILVREVADPLLVSVTGSGGINVIDLGNIESCAFIETQDLGRVFENGTFEVVGRFDNSDVRGCNLMVS